MNAHPPDPQAGGLARYCVTHREVSWAALVAVLVWGWLSFTRLAQQEDPKIPERRAVLVTRFPGASTERIEPLVTQKLEEKLNEIESIEELKSQSRAGVSIIYVTQRPANRATVEQEWDRVRAKLKEATLPEGCEPPFLDTDFGNTITLLLGVASPPAGPAECEARAHLIRTALTQSRASGSSTNRAAVFAFFPESVADTYRLGLQQRFKVALETSGLARDIQLLRGATYVMADFVPLGAAPRLREFLADFERQLAGSEGELHPDFAGAVLLMGDEDPQPKLLAQALPRYSYRQLEKTAILLEDELKLLPSAGRVRKIGNVAEMVHLFYSTPNMEGYRLSPDQVLNAIATRNAIIPSGTLRTEGQGFPVRLSGEFKSEKDLLDVVVGLSRQSPDPTARRKAAAGNGAADVMPVYLRDLFEVRRGYENPVSFSVDILRRTGPETPLETRRAVLVAVEMKEGNIIGQFNREARAAVQRLAPRLPDGVTIETLSDQPAAVNDRIGQFSKCFLEAVLVVVLVSLFLMDWRSALVVALAIPLTIAMTLGGMKVFNLPLHQISIAALIIALGMLVDDPVVASDGINRELAHGHPRGVAAWLGPHRLRRAILFGTIINIVAFVPLVLLPGDKGAFIFALPAVVTLSLVSSRIVSMTFVPLLGYYLLRGQKGLEAGGELRSFFLFRPVDRALIALLPRYKRLLQAALAHPWRAVAVAYGLLLLSFALVPLFGTQFFPPAERNQLLIDVDLPESASIRQTREVCQQIAGLLRRHAEIRSAAVFTGGTAPRFYYNVSPREPGSYLAQVLVNTYRADQVPPLLQTLRQELDREIAGARCVVKQLEQGPPVETPIQIRLSGDDLDRLRGAADQVASRLRQAGAYKVHDDLGRRMPTLEISIDQDRANSLDISNAEIGRVVRAAFSGLRVTELREGDHLIPVVVRMQVEERNEAEKIQGLYVRSLRDKLVPLENFATVELKPQYATIAHFNKLRTVTVKAYSPFGVLPSRVLARAKPELTSLRLPPGCRMEFAGEDKELRRSQSEMATVMAVSIALITLAMIIQFSSVTKAIVVILTVPLGLVGAFLGVALTRANMGFTGLLGIVSLAGVIVSHIIVLSDFIEEARSEGVELKEALLQAGLVRLRAVLVTVLATVGGLIPLALTGGELWRPLTSVHIFGLLLATMLTLVILPVWYYLFCAKLKFFR